MSLEQEQSTYEREREALKRTGARYVLIKGETIIATFETFEAGVEAGYERFGLAPFMVNAIQDEDYYIHIPAYTIVPDASSA